MNVETFGTGSVLIIGMLFRQIFVHCFPEGHSFLCVASFLSLDGAQSHMGKWLARQRMNNRILPLFEWNKIISLKENRFLFFLTWWLRIESKKMGDSVGEMEAPAVSRGGACPGLVPQVTPTGENRKWEPAVGWLVYITCFKIVLLGL